MASHNRLLGAISIIVLFTGAITYLFSTWNPDYAIVLPAIKAETYRAPKSNPWADLSKAEAEDIYEFLYLEYPHLNLTKTPKTGLENHIKFVEILRPNKTDTLSYLANQAESPQRWAKAAIAQTIENENYITYYQIGPLPISSESNMFPLEFIFNSGRHHVKNPMPSFARFQQWGISLAANVSDITWDLVGAVANPQDNDDPESLVAGARATFIKDGNITYWMSFSRRGLKSNARSILPQGIYVKIEGTNTDMEDWQTKEWYYNGVFYETADDLRKAMESPSFMRTPPNLDGSWTETEDFESAPPGRDMPPPVMVQPGGPRYRLDKKEQYISWMGFEFYLAFSQSTGPALFDIKFNGDRVIYELGLQEAMAHYAGDDPVQGGQEFLDTFFGMGKYAFELVPGYDCPAYADYLSTTFHQTEQATTNPNNICVFEYTADHALQRHTAQYHVTVSRNTYLTIRSVSTVGNYDYTIDYIFYLDGAIEVKVRASGFIFAAFYDSNTANATEHYGYRIHDAAQTSMHDHVINFKADMDIVGTSNSLVRVAVEPTTRSYPWEQPEVPIRNTMTLVNHPVDTETGLDWPRNGAEFYTVYSTTAVNAWGEKRGYRITPGTGMGTPPHLAIKNSTTLGKSALWSEHDIWVLRRKDSEPKSADPLNYLEPLDPIQDFSLMANGESLVPSSNSAVDGQADADDYDGDLVLYFNLGAHHVPHAGDIPNTLMHTSASSVMFVPHNFHDRDPSRATVQGVRLELEGNNGIGWLLNDKLATTNDNNDDIANQEGAGDLRNRHGKRGDSVEANKNEKKHKPKVKYFGGTYTAGVELKKEDLEPDMSSYDSKEIATADLSFNASHVLGVWERGFGGAA